MPVTRKFHNLSASPTYKTVLLEAENPEAAEEVPPKAQESGFEDLAGKEDELTKTIDRSILNPDRRNQVFAHIDLIERLLGRADPKIRQSILGQVLLDYFKQGDRSTKYTYRDYNNTELWKKWNDTHPNDQIRPNDEKHGAEIIAQELANQIKAIQKFIMSHGSNWSDFVAKPNEHANRIEKQYMSSKTEYNKMKRRYEELKQKLNSLEGTKLIDNILQSVETEKTEKDMATISFIDRQIAKLQENKSLGKEAINYLQRLMNDVSFDLLRVNGVLIIKSLSDDQKALCKKQFEALRGIQDQLKTEQPPEVVEQLRQQSTEIAHQIVDIVLKHPRLFTDEQMGMLSKTTIDVPDPKTARKKTISLAEFRALGVVPQNLAPVVFGTKSFDSLDEKARDNFESWRDNYIHVLEELKHAFSSYGTESKAKLLSSLNAARQQNNLGSIIQELGAVGGPMKQHLDDIINTAQSIDPTINSENPNLDQIRGALQQSLKTMEHEMSNIQKNMDTTHAAWKEAKDPIVALATMIVEKLADTQIDLDHEVAKRYELGTVAIGKSTFNVSVIVTLDKEVTVDVKPLQHGEGKKRTLGDIIPGAEKVASVSESIINDVRNVICEAEGMVSEPVTRKFINIDEHPKRDGRTYPSWRSMVGSILDSKVLKAEDSERKAEEKEKAKRGKVVSLQQLPMVRMLYNEPERLTSLLNDEENGVVAQNWILDTFEKFGGWFEQQKYLITRGKKIPKKIQVHVKDEATGQYRPKEVDFMTYLNALTEKLERYVTASQEAPNGKEIATSVLSVPESILDKDERLDFERTRQQLDEFYQQYAMEAITPVSHGEDPNLVPMARPNQKRNKFYADYNLTVFIPKTEFFDMTTRHQAFETTETAKNDVDKDIIDYILGFKDNPGKLSQMAWAAKLLPGKTAKAAKERYKDLTQLYQKILSTPAPRMSFENIKEHIKTTGKYPPGIYSAGSAIFNGPRLFNLVKNALQSKSAKVSELNFKDRTYQQLAHDIVDYISDNLMKREQKVTNLSKITGEISASDPERGLIQSDILTQQGVFDILSSPGTVVKIGGVDYHPMVGKDGLIKISKSKGILLLDHPPPPEAVEVGNVFTIVRLPEPEVFDINGTLYRSYVMPTNDTVLTVDRVVSPPFKWNKRMIKKFSEMWLERFGAQHNITPEKLAAASDTQKIKLFEKMLEQEVNEMKESKYEMYIHIPKSMLESEGISGRGNRSEEEQEIFDRVYKNLEEQIVDSLKNPKIVGTITRMISKDSFQSNDLIDHNINLKKPGAGEQGAYVETPVGNLEIESFNKDEGIIKLLHVPKPMRRYRFTHELKAGDRFVIHNVDYDVNDTVLRSYHKEDRSMLKNEFLQATKNRLKYGLPAAVAGEETPSIHSNFTEYMDRLHSEYVSKKASLAGGPVADDFLRSRAELIQDRFVNFLNAAKQAGIQDEKRILEIFRALELLYDPAIVSAWGEPYMDRAKWLMTVFGKDLKKLDNIVSDESEKEFIVGGVVDPINDLLDELTDAVQEERYPGSGANRRKVLRTLLAVVFNYRRSQFIKKYLLPYKFKNDEEAMLVWLKENAPFLLAEQDRDDDLYKAVVLTPQEKEEYKAQVEKDEQLEDADLGWNQVTLDDVNSILNRKYKFAPSEGKSEEENIEAEEEVSSQLEALKKEAKRIWGSKDREMKKRFYKMHLLEDKQKDPSMLDMLETITNISCSPAILARSVTLFEAGDRNRLRAIYETSIKHALAYKSLDVNGREVILEYLLENMA